MSDDKKHGGMSAAAAASTTMEESKVSRGSHLSINNNDSPSEALIPNRKSGKFVNE